MAIKIEINKSIQEINSLQAESLNIQTSTLDPKLLELLNHMISKLKNDKSLNEGQVREANDDIKILLRELQIKKPRQGIIKSIVSSLGSLSSIASFVDKIHTFLPKFWSLGFSFIGEEKVEIESDSKT